MQCSTCIEWICVILRIHTTLKHKSSNAFYEVPLKLQLDKIHAICKVCKEITSLTCVFHSELDIWIPQPFHAEVPVDWWDSEADKSLLIGVFKHGKKHVSIFTQVPILGIYWLHINGANMHALLSGSKLAFELSLSCRDTPPTSPAIAIPVHTWQLQSHQASVCGKHAVVAGVK